MAVKLISKPTSAMSPFASTLPTVANRAAASSSNFVTTWPEYMVDALQRSVLFLELLRQRGNEEIEITSRPMATVLRFGHEVLLDGRSLPRPMNYALSRIVPPPGVATDPRKRPVVVIDPRAGQGPGIGGFKAESEIGDALNAGHPVYFIGFGATPAPGQQFLDVVEGQVKFFERVVELHPDAPRPLAIGNCQAGYQTLMVTMLRPDLFGPCLVAGSPMSYWQGVHGKDPMRYSGGLLGGSWLTAMTSDLGNGKFDGTWLVLNFDILNPANWLWGKQYEIYTNIDTGAERYPRVREVVGRLHPAERRRTAVPGGQSLHRRQADPQPAAVARWYDLRCSQHHLADHRVHLDGRQHQPAAADTRLDPRSISGRRRHPCHRPDDRVLPEPQGRASRHLRLHQGGCEAGRGVRAADGRHRLPAARSL